MWKNTVEPGRTQMKILRKPIISCVTQATDTLSEYVKLNPFTTVARKRPTVYIYIHCLPCSHQYYIRAPVANEK